MSDYIFFSILFGLCIGSFLNVVIYRIPRNEGIIYSRSSCPSCKRNLQINDLIPLISWILLKGKCRYCYTKISWRYPLVEVLTAISFLLCLLNSYHAESGELIFYKFFFACILFSCLLSLSFIDIRYMIIPRQISNFGIAFGIIYILVNTYLTTNTWSKVLVEHLYAGLIGITGTYFLNLLIQFVFKKPGIGAGDGKLFALSGIWLGLSGLEVTAVISFLIAGISSIIGLATKKIKRGQYIPFGPFICFAIALTWLFGSQFWIHSLSDLFWWKKIIPY